MKRLAVGLIWFWCLVWSAFAWADDSALSETEIVRARIGIQVNSGDTLRAAKMSNEQVAAEDQFRIYAIPEFKGHVYVIYAAPGMVELLNPSDQIIVPGNNALVLPSSDNAYFFRSAVPSVSITILCSPDSLSEVETLFQFQQASVSEWAKLEQQFAKQSKLAIGEMLEKPWDFGGRTREIIDNPYAEEFVNTLFPAQGKGIVFRKYAFTLEK